jgi:hypothetical protein
MMVNKAANRRAELLLSRTPHKALRRKAGHTGLAMATPRSDTRAFRYTHHQAG